MTNEFNLEFLILMIEQLCGQRKMSVKSVLEDCGLKRVVVDNMKKGSIPSIDKIFALANYFNVSVDYLLGRTDNPNCCSGDNITIGDIDGNYNMTIGKGGTKPLQIDGLSKEMLEKFKNLDFDKKVEVMALISSLSKK